MILAPHSLHNLQGPSNNPGNVLDAPHCTRFFVLFPLHIYSLSHNWEESPVSLKTKERKIMEAAADIN